MTGSPRRSASAPRISNPPQPASPKLVAPFDEMTPSALAGPGVSRPIARTAERHAGEPEHQIHRVDQGLDGLVRALPDVAGNFRHLVEEEPAFGVENRPVVRRPAVIQADDNALDRHPSSSSEAKV